ncbi:hypothetical protein J1614_008960 [Plenodomus biglobosus]|nr:hypothetical protein J1614_008960 [Plenodomus biglobosus]
MGGASTGSSIKTLNVNVGQSANPSLLPRQGNCLVAPRPEGQPHPQHPPLQLVEFWLFHRPGNPDEPEWNRWIDIGRHDPAQGRLRRDVQIQGWRGDNSFEYYVAIRNNRRVDTTIQIWEAQGYAWEIDGTPNRHNEYPDLAVDTNSYRLAPENERVLCLINTIFGLDDTRVFGRNTSA